MECPKCSFNIDDKMLVCPNCKKVLKLVCPQCKTINKKNTCKKCGFTIVTKCHQCGKINQTISGKCGKCGFNTYTSLAINSSDIDEFACITVELPNVNEIKTALGSTKLFDKFKLSLDKKLNDYVNSIQLTREIIDGLYVIKFNKDFSFANSANNAIKSAIDIQNLIMELNFKLDKVKGISIQSNIAVLKRDINSQPSDFKSGFDIRLMNQSSKELRLLNNLQVIIDSGIYEVTCDNFSLSTLSSTQVKGNMVMFFELNLKKYVQIPKEVPKEDDDSSLVTLPKFHTEIEENAGQKTDDIYDIEEISFEEIRCNFLKTKSINLIPEILNKVKQPQKSIISVKCDKNLAPKTAELLEAIENSHVFEQVYRITCHDEMKYKPYGFFSELISGIYNFSQSPNLFPHNDFSMFKEIDPAGFVKNLLSLNELESPAPEDLRFALFDTFFNIFYSMSNSLVYIENIEKIDDTSFEILQIIFEKFDTLDITLLTIGDKNFALHKSCHFLLGMGNYTEINVKTTPFTEIIEKNIKRYQPILESHYIQKISQYTKGSPLYLNQAIGYLMENGLLEITDNALNITEFRNILIPATLDELISKRLKYLAKHDENAYKLFAMALLIGPRLDFATLGLLDIPEEMKEIQILADRGHVYLYNNAFYIQNYNLYKDAFLKHETSDVKQIIASELLDKLFSSDVPSPTEALLYNLLDDGRREFEAWEKSSHFSTSMGDFSAYLNCSINFLNLINDHIDENSEKTIDDYKLDVFENISNLLYRYTPEKIQSVAQIIIEHLDNPANTEKAINLCYKMVQGCLSSGNYSQALKLTHKILSRAFQWSIDPRDESFNIAFFLISMIKTEVLFSTGDLRECIESGEEILDVITEETIPALKPQELSKAQFGEVIFDVMDFVGLSSILLLKNDFEEISKRLQAIFGGVPQSFELLILLQKTLRGEQVSVGNITSNNSKFSKILFNIIKAFNEDRNDYKKFAGDIYQAKIIAKAQKLHQIELICDLLIGYAYHKLNEDKKAEAIYSNVLERSTKNGLRLIIYIAWYLIASLKLEQNNIKVAYGIANNAVIQLEKDMNSSELLLLLFKTILSKILIAKGEDQQAEMCLNHANFIKNKYKIEIDLL